MIYQLLRVGIRVLKFYEIYYPKSCASQLGVILPSPHPCPPCTLALFGDIFGHHTGERGYGWCYWHLVSRGQECY